MQSDPTSVGRRASGSGGTSSEVPPDREQGHFWDGRNKESPQGDPPSGFPSRLTSVKQACRPPRAWAAPAARTVSAASATRCAGVFMTTCSRWRVLRRRSGPLVRAASPGAVAARLRSGASAVAVLVTGVMVEGGRRP